MSELPALPVWVLDEMVQPATLERLGDARKVADAIGGLVGVLIVGDKAPDNDLLTRHGADYICYVEVAAGGCLSRVSVAAELLPALRPRLVLVGGESAGREWGGRLAARLGWKLVSPALFVQVRNENLVVTGLHGEGSWARKVTVPPKETVVCTFRPGIAEPAPANPNRARAFTRLRREPVTEPAIMTQKIPADPTTVDIRDADRLVAGGKGLGSAAGFATLRRVAERLGAGVAASRMVVDLGWIEQDRQVGQTGKSVTPELYLACGISGASHHLEGMSQARNIVAINTDPNAPIFRIAHLGLVADLYSVLQHVEEGLVAE